jgi:hypothetical protein
MIKLKDIMKDIEIAKHSLQEKDLTLAIVKNGLLLFSTRSNKISGFLEAIDKLGDELVNASLADKIAGKAIALLCVYSRIEAVHALVLSRKALAFLNQNGIDCSWNELVENVLDSNKTGICPFEKAAEEISDPKIAYQRFKEMIEKLRACKSQN